MTYLVCVNWIVVRDEWTFQQGVHDNFPKASMPVTAPGTAVKPPCLFSFETPPPVTLHCTPADYRSCLELGSSTVDRKYNYLHKLEDRSCQTLKIKKGKIYIKNLLSTVNPCITGNTIFAEFRLTAVLIKFLGVESKTDLSSSLSHQVFEL